MQTDFFLQTDLLLLERLVVAAVLTALLGWERERAGKSAGLRTHILVGIGSALFVGLTEVLMHQPGAVADSVQLDPVRGIHAVATGIGFIGAGIIFVARGGSQVVGVTTAASIWATAAVGSAVGLGRYVLAFGATVLLLIVLHLLARFEYEVLRPDQPGARTTTED